MTAEIPWNGPFTRDRTSPRECVREARDSLNRAYACRDGYEGIGFIRDAVDWQRRALEQMAEGMASGESVGSAVATVASAGPGVGTAGSPGQPDSGESR